MFMNVIFQKWRLRTTLCQSQNIFSLESFLLLFTLNLIIVLPDKLSVLGEANDYFVESPISGTNHI